MAIPFPHIDPVAVMIGPIQIRWYALAYLAGFLLGWRYCFYQSKQNPKGPQEKLFDMFLSWAVVGTIIGGRIGYVIVYNGRDYFEHPLEILKVWHGGMSFHGGMIGVILAAWLYTRRNKINFFAFTDVLACVTPIGLFLGRLANFINGELYGRVSNVPWAMTFPRGGFLPRHPSQLYEAMLEGVVLFVIMFMLARVKKFRLRPGYLSGMFLIFYGLFRFGVECFREPDIQLGYFFGGTTMGQMLSVPMVLFGIYTILFSERRVKARAIT